MIGHMRARADSAVAKWLGRQSYLDDLASLDRELYKGLTSKASTSSSGILLMTSTEVVPEPG
jgi:ubiquitin-protein ligase E3 C